MVLLLCLLVHQLCVLCRRTGGREESEEGRQGAGRYAQHVVDCQCCAVSCYGTLQDGEEDEEEEVEEEEEEEVGEDKEEEEDTMEDGADMEDTLEEGTMTHNATIWDSTTHRTGSFYWLLIMVLP